MKPGEVIQGKYRLDQRLGVGGMGEVWRATHTGTGREFAVKFMHAHVAASPVARDRFAREARASAQINHPSIVDIFDVGEHDGGTLYLVMELLSGMLLVDALAGDPRLSVRDFLTVMHDVAEALGAAHAAGIVHRDIKPENIFLHRDRATGVSVPRILDFGIGKFAGGSGSSTTASGALLGSPRYMSPEQTRSATSADGRADLWSCGVILFEGLTGTWPHEGDSFSSLVLAICTTPPASIDTLAPGLPESLRSIVRDCLEPVELRIADAELHPGRDGEAARGLRAAGADGEARSLRGGRGRQARRRQARRRRRVGPALQGHRGGADAAAAIVRAATVAAATILAAFHGFSAGCFAGVSGSCDARALRRRPPDRGGAPGGLAGGDHRGAHRHGELAVGSCAIGRLRSIGRARSAERRSRALSRSYFPSRVGLATPGS